MATLSSALAITGPSPAIIVPSKPKHSIFSYDQVNTHVYSFQRKLAALGIAPQDAVSIALPNSYEFIVAFLATSWQRAIAAPLNPAYKRDEFEFYIGDLNSAVALCPQGSYKNDEPAVQAARKHNAAIGECFWDGHEVVLDIKERGKLANRIQHELFYNRPDDFALVLHTSGTTGKPKAVSLSRLDP